MGAEDALHWSLVSRYFEAAANGRFVVPECTDCGETHFPPRTLCPYCLSSSLGLRRSSGQGTVYAITVVHVDYHPVWGERTPYCNVLVDLDDGPIVFANLVGCDSDAVAVGDPVTVVFESIENQQLPVFTPINAINGR